MAKGFTRLSDSIHDLALAILDAMEMLKVSTTRSISQHNWMGFSSSLSPLLRTSKRIWKKNYDFLLTSPFT
jgi:hypothetical protein